MYHLARLCNTLVLSKEGIFYVVILQKDNDYSSGPKPGVFYYMILRKDVNYSSDLRPGN